MKILLATNNPGKKKEIQEILNGVSIEIFTLKDFPKITEEPIESGQTFEENAQIKAQFFAEKLNTKMLVLSEDSGILLEAFPDKFGIKTKREIEAENDIEYLRKFLDLLETVDNRKAAFVSVMALLDPVKKTQKTFRGETKGEIVEFPGAPIEKGIPISCVFQPEGTLDVYSAMTANEKNKCSHRGKAGEALRNFLKNY